MFPPVDPHVSYPSLLPTFDPPIIAQALQAVLYTRYLHYRLFCILWNTIRYDCVEFVRHVNVVKSINLLLLLDKWLLGKGYWISLHD